MSAVADKLREARALIERGWTRGDFERDGRVCALGAIRKVTRDASGGHDFGIRLLRGECCDTLAKAIGTNLGWPSEMAVWNDRQPSKKPVLAAFDKAIDLASQEAAK